MEFRDLKKQYQLYKEEFDAEILGIISKGSFIGGSVVKELEEQLAEYVGVEYCISCANGTDALQLALMCLEIGPGDAVFVPDFTFFSTAETVALAGAVPILVDIEEDTFNISPISLEKAIANTLNEGKYRPKAIIPVDLFGQPADFGAIRKIADKYSLQIIEDGAQGFGGSIGKRKACGFGDISTTSFFPAKPLGCYGDGGAIFTDNYQWKEKLNSLKVHGKGDNKYDNVRVGLNSRLDAIQAAVLKVKLSKFDEELALVNYWADRYTELLKSYVKCPEIKPGFRSSWAQYTILLKNREMRDYIQKELEKFNVPTMIYYAKGMHEQKALSSYLKKDDVYPVTEAVCSRCLSLPMHPYLTEQDISFVADKLYALLK